MPKKRQIPRLFERQLASGTAYYWKPSASLGKRGFVAVRLSDDFAAAIAEARERNEHVDSVLRGDGPTTAIPAPRVVRFDELVARYLGSDDYCSLKPNTQREYRSRLTKLQAWARDRNERSLPVRDIDEAAVLDLRKVLIASSSRFTTAAVLRVLRLLLAFAGRERIIPKGTNPASEIRIPEPPKRKRRLIRDDLSWLFDAAKLLGFRHIQIGIALGFYTTQRESDLLATTRFRMTPIRDISDDARRALMGRDGRVLGITLEQSKTGQIVSLPLVPIAREAVEQRLDLSAASSPIVGAFLVSKDAGRECHPKTFQRDFRSAADTALHRIAAAARKAHADGDRDRAWELIDAGKRMRGIQFRDLRRSGMCWMRDLGVPPSLIATISGHSIQQTQRILDTYLPTDTRAAAEAMAMAVTRQAERDASPDRSNEKAG